MFAGNDDFPHSHVFEIIDMSTAHVDYPSKRILLCGGPYETSDRGIQSMRGVFYERSYHGPFPKYDLTLAEDVSREFQASPETYDDLLSLESDLAQLSVIILLFSESFGSAAELGAFCLDKDISKRLLVVISERYHDDSSFVKLGPLKHLRNLCGESAVCVIPSHVWDDRKCKSCQGNDPASLMEYVTESFIERVGCISTRTTFNNLCKGHIILALVGIVYHYSALTLDELYYIALELKFEINEGGVRKAMFCAIQCEWVVLKNVGSQCFYVIKSEKNPLQVKKRANSSISWTQWRCDVLDFWKEKDRRRHDAIRGVRQT